jgi:hypothetical protein
MLVRRAMIKGAAGLSVQTCNAMAAVMILFSDAFDRFERWFNKRFGWFFTNGMKATRERRRMFKA